MRYDFEKRNTVVTILNGIFLVLLLLLWKPISLVFSFFHKLAADVLKNLYGRVVALLATIIFVFLLAYFSKLSQ